MIYLNEAVEATENQTLSSNLEKGHFNPKAVLENLEAARIQWENTTYRTSNQELYGILATCLGFMGSLSFEQHKARNEELQKFFKSRGYKYSSESPLATRVVKAVFGSVDRRRISTYSLVLRQAIKEQVTALNLPNWIEVNGGVQEIKLGRSTKYVSPTVRAENAKANFGSQTVLANVKTESLSLLADAEHMGTTCVLLAEQMADGSFDIRAVIRTSGVVNAAYVALYNEQLKASKKAEVEIQAANDADGALAKQA